MCITLYSKWEDRDYREIALKIDTFSASLKLSYIDIQRLSLPEGCYKNTAKQAKRGEDASPQMKDHIF